MSNLTAFLKTKGYSQQDFQGDEKRIPFSWLLEFSKYLENPDTTSQESHLPITDFGSDVCTICDKKVEDH